MSLVRAFTTRRNKPDADVMTNLHLGRAASQRAGRPINRSNISPPVALVSTTNMLSYEAPDIVGTAPISIRTAPEESVSTDSSSGDESDMSILSISTNDTVTDNSSIEQSPTSAQPEPNHLSCYFNPAVDTKMPSRSPSLSRGSFANAPKIPQRVPSHSKKAHEHIHRKRTIQRMMSPPGSISSFADMLSPTQASFVQAPKDSPFGSELKQLEEVAEGYGHVVHSAEADPDEVYLMSHGLAQLNASDYLAEIQDLIYVHLAEEPAWI